MRGIRFEFLLFFKSFVLESWLVLQKYIDSSRNAVYHRKDSRKFSFD